MSEEEERMGWEAEWHRQAWRDMRAMVINRALGEESEVARTAALHLEEARRLEGLLDG